MYRDEIYSLQNLLSRTQAGPGRTVKKEQEEISPNHVQRINLISVNEPREKFEQNRANRCTYVLSDPAMRSSQFSDNNHL